MARRAPSPNPNLKIINIMFDDNPPPFKRKGNKFSEHLKSPNRQFEHKNGDEVGEGEASNVELLRCDQGYDPVPTSKELMSYALHMNSHQIAKELLLDNEDENFIQETSSFLTGNTDLLNAGSIRRDLSERQLFLKAVEEVERARARIISSATRATPQQQTRSPRPIGPVPVSLLDGASSEEEESDEYSEKYDSDFSADSIDLDQKSRDDPGADPASPQQPSASQRIISNLTNDYYEDDYEEYEHEPSRPQQPVRPSDGRGVVHESKQDCKDDDSGASERDDDDVFALLDEDSDSEPPPPPDQDQDEEHARSILKRLHDAHQQRSPMRLRSSSSTATATAAANHFDSSWQRVHLPARDLQCERHGDDDEDELAELELDDDGVEDEGSSSVQYSQLKSRDSAHHFSVGGSSSNDNHRRRSFQGNKTDNSYLSKFSASTQLGSSSPDGREGSSSEDMMGLSIEHSMPSQTPSRSKLKGDRGGGNESGADKDDVVDHKDEDEEDGGRGGGSSSSTARDRGAGAEPAARARSLGSTVAPGKLSSSNNIDVMISGGLNEWLVMNMKENTSTALRTMHKRVDHHHIRDSDDARRGTVGAGEGADTLSRDLEGRFSVCTEVYQRYLAEAVQLKAQLHNFERARILAHELADSVLQRVGQTSVEGGGLRRGSRGGRRSRGHSAEKAKDDFDLQFLGEERGGESKAEDTMLRSDGKRSRAHRQQAAGQKMASASVQLECVSKLEGGRGGDKDEDEGRGRGVGSSDEVSIKGRDAKAEAKQHHDDYDDVDDDSASRVLLTQSFDQKRLEVRKRNRRAIFAAMHLGDIAGKLVIEKSKSAANI